MTFPTILTYGPHPEAPAPMRFCAAMVPDNRPGSHWMTTGPTAEAARAQLEAMWAKEHPDRSASAEKARAARSAKAMALDVIL